jgi:nuclear pore complex protein Nup62
VSAALKNKTVEEIINMWNSELEEDAITFRRQAIEIAKWDRILLENSDKILALHGNVKRVELAQKQLDSNLEMISRQQGELHELMDQLEAEVDKVYSNHESEMTPADLERENGYQLAENVNGELDQMAITLKEIIKKLNSANERAVDQDNPVHQIVDILNSHLHSLQWVTQQTAQVQTKLARVSKSFELQKAQHDNWRRQF